MANYNVSVIAFRAMITEMCDSYIQNDYKEPPNGGTLFIDVPSYEEGGEDYARFTVRSGHNFAERIAEIIRRDFIAGPKDWL